MAPFAALMGLSLAFQSLPDLCNLFDASCISHLSLKTNENGVRGVFVDDEVPPGMTVLQIPIKACLRDDEAPLESGEWPVRMASCLLNLRKNEDKTEAQQVWLDLLPTDLSKSLPIHWDESLVRSCQSTDLELAVDSSYFVRADAMTQLQDCFPSERDCQDALDIVQTRSCRVEPGIRLLAPIFDLLNHGGNHANAEFLRIDEHLVVRTTRQVEAGSELLIDYGESARPAWKCLLSYGFVPTNDDMAELLVDGMRYSVGPESIPYELVEALSAKFGQTEVDLSLAVCNFLADCAEQITNNNDNESDDQEPPSRAAHLATDLRQSQRHALVAFARGLREYHAV
jgi:hypothetical protein